MGISDYEDMAWLPGICFLWATKATTICTPASRLARALLVSPHMAADAQLWDGQLNTQDELRHALSTLMEHEGPARVM